jgi:hypothetical protein
MPGIAKTDQGKRIFVMTRGATGSIVAVLLALGQFGLAADTLAQATGSHEQVTQRYLETPAGRKPRVVITADPELDDNNSLIRYVLHAADFTTEGLIYASSMFHWRGDGEGGRQNLPARQYNRNGLDLCPCTSWRWSQDERFIDDIIDAYEVAWPNLVVHDPEYPTADELRSKIRWGNVSFEGEMAHDTDGSDLIKSLLLDDVDEPIYLHAWGGQSTINRALASIEEEFAGTALWPEIRAKVVSKAVIHPSGDQDETGYTYLRTHWPDIRYGVGGGARPVGMSYGAQANAHPDDRELYSAAWMAENVRSKGPLGWMVRVWGDGRRMVDNDPFDYFHLAGLTAEELWGKGYDVWTAPQARGEFLGEGDTFTFLSLIDNGLEGWRQGNRGDPDSYALAADITSSAREPNSGPPPLGAPDWVLQLRGLSPSAARASGIGVAGSATPGWGEEGGDPTQNRFLRPVMNDLAGRLDWATMSNYAEANHYPEITLAQPQIVASRGERVRLTASVADPDHDTVAVDWWPFEGNGTYRGEITLEGAEGLHTSFVVPDDAQPGDTIHIVAEANDQSDMVPLTRYARAVVTVR